MRNIEDVVRDIDSFIPVNDEWEALDELVEEACNFNDIRVVKSLLFVLERNPEHDGYGTFWSVVHGLENIGNYEKELVQSVLNKPHEMSLLMLNRLLNSNVDLIDGKPIVEILREVSDNSKFSKDHRETAKQYLSRHAM
ncbi:hypothetical protein BCT30_24315 [Enterovibrio norvegicus]|uniref:hypothetical protein n=1 Tax=Vibrionaceae TaxID=641 RepID=UPI00080E17F4|nr:MULTISPECIES: hypothetical protein [Vibrionaceae]MCC4801069.1 hypothetical protein [Enterovibrio norvegicus]OCH57253.1 hypothetical protein A6D98_19655 [Aliivibrio fischeri]PMI37479.1 hypothetical protein BCU46_10470 [Enterovibrio norvegicus]PMN53889.1 hypothetical protein BCT30_24315 [Enterovibrio norvegicus]TKF25983.1 hypothetical protein FCV83_24465 [Enterovibrio norvegicus]